jgi:hypothetical protein
MNDSALFWAQQLKQKANVQGVAMERSVLDTIGRQIVDARATKNYNSAIDLVNKLMQFYPARSELVSLKSQLENEQQQQAADSQLKKFVLQHRHVLFDNNAIWRKPIVWEFSWSRQTVPVALTTMTFDLQGRCDHSFFRPALLRRSSSSGMACCTLLPITPET